MEGLAGIAAAAVTVLWPGITALALVYVIAAWAAVTGVLEIAAAVRLPAERRNLEQLARTPIATPDGGYTTLGSVADIRQDSGAMNIAREAGRRTMAIGIFIKGRDMGSVVADMKARVKAHVQVPDNYSVSWSGEFENQERAMQRLTVVVPISLLLIFVLLFDAFGSFKSALLILVNVPLALIGGFVALWIFGIPLSVSAAIGFIALSGQAVLNGVVMVWHFNERLARGEPMHDVIRLGSQRRLRPVLMTAVITALGIAPRSMQEEVTDRRHSESGREKLR